MSAPSLYNVCLYGAGLFENSDNTVNQKQLEAIQGSGFNLVVLWTLHVTPNGDIYYNDTKFVSGGRVVPSAMAENLPYYLKGLREGGVVKILFSIGEGKIAEDFAHIQALLDSPEMIAIVEANFGAIGRNFDIDGFDFDLEEFPLENYTKTILWLTQHLKDYTKGTITFCPYTDPSFWLNCLKDIYNSNSNQQQPVEWFNLQCYSGGAGNDPDWWAQYVNEKYGVHSGYDFIVPMYSAYENPPANVQTLLSNLQVQGGAIWNSGSIFKGQYTPTEYAQAIIAGIQQQQTAKKAKAS